MTKNVLIYARYSTDRQNEVSIETQIEVCREFAEEKGWHVVEVFSDAAISGTSFHSRPGIQALRKKIKADKIDAVLCVTVDRLSRDIEHSTKLMKEFRYHDVQIWTVFGGVAVTDMDLSLRALLSHELIQQIRYRTREGMKTAVRKGSASTCLAYGYKLALKYDVHGNRIPGLRAIDDDKAKIVIRIFEEYASGVSPRDIAKHLNDEGIPGPRGLKWRDTAIRGHVNRGSGILNNELYRGRMIWNKRNFRKDPETEKRTARANDADQWVSSEVPELRIVSEELWHRVKIKQQEVATQFAFTTTNRLNASHRPQYLLSGLLECAECGGPYAIMGKDRYGCTNHKKRLPIDELGGVCCSNQKTIIRQELEDRVITCMPAAFFSLGVFDEISKEVREKFEASYRAEVSGSDELQKQLDSIVQEQRSIIKQMTKREEEERPELQAHNDMLDELYRKQQEVSQKLADYKQRPDVDLTEKLERLREQTTPESIENVVDTIFYMMRDKADSDLKQPFINVIRMCIQTVVVGKTPGHQPPTLQVHGRIASILAAMDMSTRMEKELISMRRHDYLAGVDSGELDTKAKKKEFLDACAEELSERRLAWANLQVSVVAGAGFEPAAFRL